MAQDLEQLVLSISADTAQMRRAIRRLESDTGSGTKRIERQFDNLGKKINGTFLNVGKNAKGVFSFLGAAAGLREAQQLIDTSIRISNALKVAGLEGEALNDVYATLFASAQKNAAPIEDLVTLYSRASQSAKDLGVSQQELLKFTDNVALSLRVGGKSAQEASGALLQLSQALGNGVVQAEEYNSLLDGAQPLLQATAAGLKEAGGSVSALTRLVKDGKVSSEAFFRAFEAGAGILEDKVDGSQLTVSQGFTRLQNILIDTAREFDNNADAASLLSKFLTTLGSAISETGNIISTLIGPLKTLHEWVSAVTNGMLEMSAAFGAATGLDEIGRSLGAKPFVSEGMIQKRIDDAFGETARSDKPGLKIDVKGGESIRPVSLSDYKVPAKEKKAGKTKQVRDDDYQRETKQIQERIAAMKAETSAQALLNPLINDYGFAVEKARTQQELLTAAKEAGKTITPELSAAIDQLSTEYAQASADAERLTEKQDKLKESAEEFRDSARDVMGGFISDLVDGKSAAEALSGALKKLGDKLLNSGLDALFGGGSGGGFGALGSLLGIGGGSFAGGGNLSYFPPVPKFAKGTNNAPGGLALVGEEGPELVNLNRGASVLPNIPTMKALSGQGGVNVTYAPTNNFQGTSEELDQMRRAIAQDRAQFESKTIATIRKANSGGVKF